MEYQLDTLPNNMLLTTNYDHVIEECFIKKGLHLSPQDALHHEQIIPWLRTSTDHQLLIKLHGDADEMETTVVLDSQAMTRPMTETAI